MVRAPRRRVIAAPARRSRRPLDALGVDRSLAGLSGSSLHSPCLVPFEVRRRDRPTRSRAQRRGRERSGRGTALRRRYPGAARSARRASPRRGCRPRRTPALTPRGEVGPLSFRSVPDSCDRSVPSHDEFGDGMAHRCVDPQSVDATTEPRPRSSVWKAAPLGERAQAAPCVHAGAHRDGRLAWIPREFRRQELRAIVRAYDLARVSSQAEPRRNPPGQARSVHVGSSLHEHVRYDAWRTERAGDRRRLRASRGGCATARPCPTRVDQVRDTD